MPFLKIPFGPTYDEMAHPELIDPEVRASALRALSEDEFNPVNLFNITWKDRDNQVRKVIFPPELTGVDANIVVLLGMGFPSGSHKVGPAYSTLIEACVDGTIDPDRHTILGPSTGNFGIGVAYICRLMGYRAVVIMPDNMSRERYDRIRRYGGELDLTPGTESDVILTLRRTHELMRNPDNFALAQFELVPNYRFHRHVTGAAVVEAVSGIGNGRVACFVSAPGSAGTLAAGDHVKKVFPETRVTAVEPYECSTLSTGGRGQHRIEGIGDKMCTLIHNILTTDFVLTVRDEECVQALKVMRDGGPILQRMGVSDELVARMRDMFGVSGMCNIVGAIRMARYLRLGPGDNVVTIATDGFDR
ncbi:MAG: pyridoxal-phosphate dependent enzyme, partial [Firmicutes bacterium]|nr:pyridoxal-phosphate dependent enzyme [Bacillota bacterium]